MEIHIATYRIAYMYSTDAIEIIPGTRCHAHADANVKYVVIIAVSCDAAKHL